METNNLEQDPKDLPSKAELENRIHAEERSIHELEQVTDAEKRELGDLKKELHEIEEGHHPVTIKVNNQPVEFKTHHAMGLTLKETAIAQHVKIELDFSLFKRSDGHSEPIADDQRIQLHQGEEFRAVAPDDQSAPIYN
jgi:Multiubiquitin